MDTTRHMQDHDQVDPNPAVPEQNQLCSTPFHPDLVSLEQRCKTAKPKSYHELVEDIFRGDMPESCTTLAGRDAFYSSYLDTIQATVKGRVKRVDRFTDLLRFIAARTAMVLSYEEIADDVGIPKETAISWVSLLAEMGLLYLLPPHHWSGAKRPPASPKAYFLDTGLAAYLTRWDSPNSLMTGAMDAACFETYAVSRIVRSYAHTSQPLALSYYHADYREVLLLQDGNKVYPLTIRMHTFPPNPKKVFDIVPPFYAEIQPRLVICLSHMFFPYSHNHTTWLYPVWAI